MESLAERLKAFSIDEKQIADILKNKKICESIEKVLNLSGINSADKKRGNLLYGIATKITPSIEEFRLTLTKYVVEDKIANQNHLDYTISYIDAAIKKEGSIATEVLEKNCGIGVNMTDAEISQKIKEYLHSKKEVLEKIRYTLSISDYLKALREIVPFAEGKLLSSEFKVQLEAILGPETEQDKQMKADLLKKKAKEESNKHKKVETVAAEQEVEEPKKKLGDIFNARDLASSRNTPELIKQRNEQFGDVILTRFPPEPNGYLHIGHAKSINFNFGIASEYNGQCYLRFDDTNPEKENMEYINSIKDNVKWLGRTPFKTTYSSDNFEILYQCAIKLIKKGFAFVCHQNKEESRKFREQGIPSPFRDRPVEENLRIFEEMRLGLWDEGAAVLRAKIDYKSPNTTLRDPAIYRIRYVSHPHAGSKWCIYPLYDYTHPICDSLEGITYSLCTLEFEIRRELYYWYLEKLDMYRPYVWEFSRLNVSNTVLSKRKLQALVFGNHVKGWDDPRLLTIQGMRRRGYTPEGINAFCDLVSVTRNGNENVIGFQLLEHCIRKDLDNTTKRTMAVIDPVKVTITNLPDTYEQVLEAPDFPTQVERGSHKITFTNSVYVEREDTQLKDHKDFFGLAPGKVVGLKYAGVVKCIEVKAKDGVVSEVIAEFIKDDPPKPKTYLNWVSSKEAFDCEVRIYNSLFTEDPTSSDKEFLELLNPNSLVFKNGAKINKNIIPELQHLSRFQFERQGYFAIDFDSDITKKTFVWNKIVGLSDTGKQKALQRVAQA
ncbi:hypothetical protein ABPG74_004087 [Tetrahymena malaccensis]